MKRSLISLLAMLGTSIAASAAPTVIFSNVGSLPSTGYVVYGTGVGDIPASQMATLFVPDVDFTLDSIRLGLSATDAPSTFVTLHLLTGTPDLPVTLVESVSISSTNLTVSPELYSFAFSSQYSFAAGSNLWLALTNETGAIAWTANGTGVSAMTRFSSNDDLISWEIGGVVTQPAFEILGAVPERASTAPVLGTAIGLLLLAHKRRKHSRTWEGEKGSV
jgi:hypothetical protein